ncbi:MAG: radical SAM protein [Alphaproteobacteria bacterium]|nr:radical SAM protein [Alphaproteobacteria bacterium]
MSEFNLVIKLTNWCNLNCRHCMERSGLDQPYQMMPVEQVKKYINEYKKLGHHITFTGGEPFASYIQERDEYIPEIATSCVQNRITPIFETNGTWAENMYVGGIMMSKLSEIAQNHRKDIFLDIAVDKYHPTPQGAANICKLIARHQHLRNNNNIRVTFSGQDCWWIGSKISNCLVEPYYAFGGHEDHVSIYEHRELKVLIPLKKYILKYKGRAKDNNLTWQSVSETIDNPDSQDVLTITNDNQAILNHKYQTTMDNKTIEQVYSELLQHKR